MGCTSTSALPFSTWLEFAHAQGRWAHRGFADYSFEMRESCFCPAEAYEWATVDVRDGRIVRVRRLTGEDVPEVQWVFRVTIEDIFRAIAAERPDWIAQVAADFDAELGFPRSASFTAKPGVADAGFQVEARNVRSLE